MALLLVVEKSEMFKPIDVMEELLMYGKKVLGAAMLGMFSYAGMGQTDRGQKVYEQACHSCHQAGVVGAPKKNDSEAWKKRLERATLDQLTQRVMQGYKAMPPMGRCSSCDAAMIREAILWMSQPKK